MITLVGFQDIEQWHSDHSLTPHFGPADMEYTSCFECYIECSANVQIFRYTTMQTFHDILRGMGQGLFWKWGSDILRGKCIFQVFSFFSPSGHIFF